MHSNIGAAYTRSQAHTRSTQASAELGYSLIEKLKALPPQRQAEVEDFVDFLRSRDEDRYLVTAATKTAEPAFAQVWDNDDDAEYDRL